MVLCPISSPIFLLRMVLCLISSYLRWLVLFTAELLQQSMEVFIAVFMNNVAELFQHGVDKLFQREKSVVIVEMAQTKEDILTAILKLFAHRPFNKS